jgi:hypothetical protein
MANATIFRGFVFIHTSRHAAYTFLVVVFLMLSASHVFSMCMRNTQPAELNWQLDKTVNGVDFFYAMSSCDGHDVVFLKIKNKNKYSVEITWKEVFQTQLAKDKEGFSGAKKIVLPPGEMAETDCAHPSNPALRILSSQVDPTYVVSITKFNYKDISVIKMN